MAKAKKPLFGEESCFRTVQELSLDGLIILQCLRQKGMIVDFECQYANPAANRIFRTTGLQGRKLTNFFPEVKKSGLFADYIKVVEKGELQDGEIAYRTARSSGWLRHTAIKLADGLMVSLRDITEKKLWEESLKQSEARFRVITQSNMIGILFWNEEGLILDANEAFLKIIGYDREEFFRQKLSLRDLTPEEFWDLDRKAMEELEAEGSCRPFEKEFRHQDNHPIPVLWGAARLEAINYEGVAFVVDMSEKREMEKQREIFLGHELKTPLASIKGFAQLLHKRLEGSGDEKTIAYLSRIDNKVDELTQLISDLTDLTRIRVGKLEFRDEIFAFDDLIKEVVLDCQPTTKTHKIILKGKTGKAILGDRARISQVLNNLFSNAIKYSPGADRIIVGLSSGKKGVKVLVQDFGFGIPQDDQEKIFQPFFRSALSKDEVPGVGLGLYISRQILKHHGGSLDLKSREGQGTVFDLYLPQKRTP